MHVLLATSELNPYSKTGGLADMVSALAKALAGGAAGEALRVSVVTPLYRGMAAAHAGIGATPWRLAIPVGDSLVEGRFHRRDLSANLTHWFVEQPGFFDRPGLYGEGGRDHADNAARFIFLSRAALVLAGGANQPSAFDGLPFPTRPLYDGRPWFLPAVGWAYRLRDRLDRRAS